MSIHFSEQFGFNDSDFAEFDAQFQAAKAAVAEQLHAGSLGFTKLPQADVAPIEALAMAVRAEVEAVIIIGIGGSDLGARAVHRALNHQFYNLRPTGPRLFFLGDTTDPVAISEVLDVVDMTQTALVMVSKSGNTVEQMSTFILLRERLIAAVGAETTKMRIIAITDGVSGTMRTITDREGYRNLIIPADVGGRFSVFTPAGLFPLALAGLPIQDLLTGAAELPDHELAASYALLQYMAYTKRNQRIQVMMPYTYSLREVGFWFRQLWAESLGKRVNRTGEEVRVGPTPIAAIGPTDQHSQVQLYREGPQDKTFTFITVTEASMNYVLPEAFSDLEGVSYLAGHSFYEILLAEQVSTAQALQEAGQPTCTFTLDRLDAYHVGQLLYLLELATTYAGELFSINTFDQPGVERGKELMYQALGRN